MRDQTDPQDMRQRAQYQYLVNVARALSAYIDDEGVARVRGDRSGDELVLTFVVADPDRFHSHLEALNRDP